MNIERNADFEKYIDNFVREKTGFNSAQELLESKPDTKFIPISIVIGCLFFPIGLLILPFALLFVQWCKINKCANNFSRNFSITIDTDDLISFLNHNLKYLKPYFNEWTYLAENGVMYMGTGVASALGAEAVNLVTERARKAGRPVAIASNFGQNGELILAIHMRDDSLEKKENSERYYYFDVKKNPKNKNPLSLAKYSAMVRTAPILQGAMEYYLSKQINNSTV